jgi:hypothetical protein
MTETTTEWRCDSVTDGRQSDAMIAISNPESVCQCAGKAMYADSMWTSNRTGDVLAVTTCEHAIRFSGHTSVQLVPHGDVNYSDEGRMRSSNWTSACHMRTATVNCTADARVVRATLTWAGSSGVISEGRAGLSTREPGQRHMTDRAVCVAMAID